MIRPAFAHICFWENLGLAWPHDALVEDSYGAFLDSHPDNGIPSRRRLEEYCGEACGSAAYLCLANWLASP